MFDHCNVIILRVAVGEGGKVSKSGLEDCGHCGSGPSCPSPFPYGLQGLLCSDR